MSGLVSGMDTESIVAELMKAQNLKKTKLQNKITTGEWKQDKWKDLNAKIYAFYTGPLAQLRMQGSFSTKKVSSSNENKVSVTANTSVPAGTHTLKIKQLASSQFVTGAKLDKDNNSKAISSGTKLVDLGIAAGEDSQITVTAGTTTKTLTISDTTTVNDFLNTLKGAGLNASYDSTQKRFFISSKESGYSNAFAISASGSVDLTKLGLSTITKTDNGDGSVTVTGGSNISLVSPADAKVVYNGAEINSASNTITVNGLTITLKGVSDGMGTPDAADDEVINISIQNNTQAVYDMIKDFVKKYNELITEMNKGYDAVSAAGYEPLTDEQKTAMTDDQIEKWESKIKDSLFRRDGNLSSLIDMFRSIQGDAVKVDGKSYSLSSFGIASVNYTEKGLLHINGDKDDSMSSGFTDKLMQALTDDPDKVMKVFNELADNLYGTLTKDMTSSSLRSALTLYNDKEMTQQVRDYKSDLSALEKKLKDMEERYYKQFSAMESAMAKMNSQSSSLASMLGMGSN
jgi:flagellar hook-associated protein 2